MWKEKFNRRVIYVRGFIHNDYLLFLPVVKIQAHPTAILKINLGNVTTKMTILTSHL